MAQEKRSCLLADAVGPVQRAAGRKGLLDGQHRPWQGDGCLPTVRDKCVLLCQTVWLQGLKREYPRTYGERSV